MKRIIVFLGSFIVAYIILQILSGMILTMLYTPNVHMEEMHALPSEVVFGESSYFSPLIISLLAWGVAFGITKLSVKNSKMI